MLENKTPSSQSVSGFRQDFKLQQLVKWTFLCLSFCPHIMAAEMVGAATNDLIEAKQGHLTIGTRLALARQDRPASLEFWDDTGRLAEAVAARQLPAIRVNSGGHYLETAEGKPSFWLGDTAWQLMDATTREECSYYLHTRATQGFTVVQATVLAEFDGLNRPSALGERPFFGNDPARPNEKYFDRVVEIVDEAGSVGLYVALLPTWADKVTAPWGDGPRVFRSDNLPVVRAYAKYLGGKLRGRSNVVWMLGGDRPAKLDGAKTNQWPNTVATESGFANHYDWTPIWREMARGPRGGIGSKTLCLYHRTGQTG